MAPVARRPERLETGAAAGEKGGAGPACTALRQGGVGGGYTRGRREAEETGESAHLGGDVLSRRLPHPPNSVPRERSHWTGQRAASPDTVHAGANGHASR